MHGYKVKYSNCRYADERIEELSAAGRLTPRSRYSNWKPVTLSEMEGFFWGDYQHGFDSTTFIRVILEFQLDWESSILW